jgi:FkbM family methyltransferase
MVADLPLRLGKLFYGLRSVRLMRGLLMGTGASVEHERVLDWTAPNTVIDIGANRGQFSLIARARRPGARIVAFEPLAAPATAFAKLFSGDGQVDLRRVALGDTRRRLTMTVTREDDSSSLLPLGALQVELFSSRAKTTVATEVLPLDEAITGEPMTAPVLLKIDVQGYEMQVLSGATASLARVDSVYVELSFVSLYDGQALAPEVIQFLGEQGFVLSGVFNQRWSPTYGAVQGDFLFSRRGERGSTPLDAIRADSGRAVA